MATPPNTKTRRITREQVAQFVGQNPRAIKLIENLSDDVIDALPEEIFAAQEAAEAALLGVANRPQQSQVTRDEVVAMIALASSQRPAQDEVSWQTAYAAQLLIQRQIPQAQTTGGLSNPMTTAGDLIVGGVAGAPGRQGIGSNGQVLTVVAGAPAWASANSTYFKGAAWTGGNFSILLPISDVKTTSCRTAGTIVAVEIETDGAIGSCQIDFWKGTYGGANPTVANSICAASLPTITSGKEYRDTTLTGWSKTVSVGDLFVVHVNSSSVFKYIAVTLEIQP